MVTTLQQVFETKKVCVLVPTYNNAGTLATVLNNLLAYTKEIVVVNDGSTDSTAEILNGISGIQIKSYQQNQGKGFALRTGFDFARSLGYDYAITIDSDGQHYADDLEAFTTSLEQNPNAIIIGARNMDQSAVPGKSSFGNKFSNFWFWVNTGIRRNDTQSGYRLYPLCLLEKMSFVTKKFEFEIEVLVRSAWAGIDVIEVPVKVYYPEKEKRVSHFRPFKDFSRISVLNTVLVTIALLYIKPRDFFRRFKKKSSVRLFRKYFPILANPTSRKPFQLASGSLWESFRSGDFN
jgi:glycosyltransferase involved in cell wall biosynthesis